MSAPSAAVLVVEHEADCPPGWVGEWLVEAGCAIDVRRPYRGDALPADLSGHAGLVVLGGSMDAYAEGTCPWLAHVKELVRLAAAQETPALGICLGHQIAAVALGGAAQVNPRGQQIGVFAPSWLPGVHQDALLARVAGARVSVQWNNDIVCVLPPGAVPLARTAQGELQAARFAPTVWGVQSHPEAGAGIVAAWAVSDREDAVRRGVDLDDYVQRVAAAEGELQAAWRPMATAFAALVVQAGAPAW